MFRNYLRSAWRNLMKSKFFSSINIIGLSAALASCILIFLFIQHELSYDKFNAHADRIFRITSLAQGPSEKTMLAVTPAPWAPLIKKDYPEVLNYVRLLKDEKTIIGKKGEQHYYEDHLLYADSTFFDIFSYSVSKGNKQKALEAPNSVILSRETARKLFGDSDPIGQSIELNSFGRNLNLNVTGIINDMPSTSHFQFNVLVSLQTLGDLSNLWSFHMFNTYVLLNNK
ncbi:MAG: ABC transporter permease, partial [Flavisolibacter sp.]